MKIGIIGAGYIGGTLTRRLRALGHEVRVANSRAPETLAELTAETGATAVWANEAAQDADLVIVSIPQKNVPTSRPASWPRASRTRRSSRPTTTTRASATATSRPSSRAGRRAPGWPS
ncbi:MAG TPA: NAD(P)-binding domain-containing protein [Pseudonocardiaceae bacterium]|jgi:nucleoside-diphosphate-sugar epimerase